MKIVDFNKPIGAKYYYFFLEDMPEALYNNYIYTVYVSTSKKYL